MPAGPMSYVIAAKLSLGITRLKEAEPVVLFG